MPLARDVLDEGHVRQATARTARHIEAGQLQQQRDALGRRLRLGRRRLAQQFSATVQVLGLAAVAQYPVVTHARHALRYHMQQEAAYEFVGADRQLLDAVAVPAVAIREGDLAAIDGEQALVADGHTMGVTAEVFEDPVGGGEGRPRKTNPVFARHAFDHLTNAARFCQGAGQGQLATPAGTYNALAQIATEKRYSDLTGTTLVASTTEL